MILTRSRTAAPLLLLLLLTVAFTACGEEAEPASDPPRTVEVTAEDTGSSVSLSPDDEVVITLDSNVTTGFAWHLAKEPDPAVLKVVGSTYVAPDSDLVGAGGEEVWTFRAVGDGSTEIELSYERSSGETAGEPFVLSVDVAG